MDFPNTLNMGAIISCVYSSVLIAWEMYSSYVLVGMEGLIIVISKHLWTFYV